MRKSKSKNGPTRRKPVRENPWELTLYVAGKTPRNDNAILNLKRICEEYLKGNYRISVIDLMENPEIALRDQIFVTPTVIREYPAPLKKIIGDMSIKDKVLAGLDLLSLKAGEGCHG